MHRHCFALPASQILLALEWSFSEAAFHCAAFAELTKPLQWLLAGF